MKRAILIAALLVADRAEATTCMRGGGFTILPPPMGEAPVNTHVWITLPSTYAAQGLCFGDAECAKGAFGIRISRATGAGEVVEMSTVRATKGSLMMTLELKPSRLAERTRYDVYLVDKTHATQELLSTFRTGHVIDNDAPRSSGSVASSTSRPVPPKGVILLEDTHGPHVNVTLSVEAPDIIGYFAWNGTTETDPPDAFVPRTSDPTLTLGGIPVCGYESFKIKLGVPHRLRAVDLAGNLGPPVDIP